MNVREEKEYIYSLMSDITKERRRLTDIYYDLKSRLDELNSMEEIGLERISTVGYVDLRNKAEAEKKIDNIERETAYTIEDLKRGKNNDQNIDKSKSRLIEESKDSNSKKKLSRVDIKKIEGLVVNILKESDIPIKLIDLHAELQNRIEYNVDIKNFRNNIMPKIHKNNKRVGKAGRGYYQYENSSNAYAENPY